MQYKGPDTGNSKKAVPKSALRLPMQKCLGRPKVNTDQTRIPKVDVWGREGSFLHGSWDPEEFRDPGVPRILNFADGTGCCLWKPVVSSGLFEA